MGRSVCYCQVDVRVTPYFHRKRRERNQVSGTSDHSPIMVRCTDVQKVSIKGHRRMISNDIALVVLMAWHAQHKAHTHTHAYLGISHLCDLVEVVLCACGDSPKEDALRHAPAVRHAHAVQKLLLSVEILLLGLILSVAEGAGPAWDD